MVIGCVVCAFLRKTITPKTLNPGVGLRGLKQHNYCVSTKQIRALINLPVNLREQRDAEFQAQNKFSEQNSHALPSDRNELSTLCWRFGRGWELANQNEGDC